MKNRYGLTVLPSMAYRAITGFYRVFQKIKSVRLVHPTAYRLITGFYRVFLDKKSVRSDGFTFDGLSGHYWVLPSFFFR